MGVDKKGYIYARKLGLAMQLTNFLRDVKEDWQRGRIYIPLEDLKKFEIGVDEWGNVDPKKFDTLMLFEIERVRKIFAEARKGIKYIPNDCQRAVLMATSLYEVVLDKIAKNPTAIWVNKPKVSFQDRLRVMRQK
jgi:phytoene synthase